MMQLSEYINKSIDTEKEVYEFIFSKLSPGEKMLNNQNSLAKYFENPQYYPDAYLPEGCKLLGFPKNTFIEIKYCLKPGSVSRYLKAVKLCKPADPNVHLTFCLIYKDAVAIDPATLNDKEILCLSVDELMQKEEQVCGKPVSGTFKKDSLSQEFIRNIACATFRSSPSTFILGAGVSQSAGLPGWDELLIKLIENRPANFLERDYENICKECGHSSIITGRFIQQLYANAGLRLEDAIHSILYGSNNNSLSSSTIDAICKLIQQNQDRVQSVITYNYDDLIEDNLTKFGVDNHSVCDNNQPLNKFPVIHVHGVLDRAKSLGSTIVLSEAEYHDIYRRAYHWSNVEQLHAMQRSSCFFVGLSMNDPNLRRLLDIVQGENNSKDGNRGQMRHFAYIEKNHVGSSLEEKADEYRKQYEQMLAKLGVYVIWYEGFNNLPEELEKLMGD